MFVATTANGFGEVPGPRNRVQICLVAAVCVLSVVVLNREIRDYTNKGADNLRNIRVARSVIQDCACDSLAETLGNTSRHVEQIRRRLHFLSQQVLYTRTAHLVPSPAYEFGGSKVGILAGTRQLQWSSVSPVTSYSYAHDDGLFDVTHEGLRLQISGKYTLSVHLMMAGRTGQAENMSNVHCAFSLFIRRYYGDDHVPHRVETVLMSSVTSQPERGLFYERSVQNTDVFPYDSAHMSGVFHLVAGDILQLRAHTDSQYCRLNLEPTATFLSAVLLQHEYGGTMPVHG